MRVAGAVALVTGGSSGIGRAVAGRLAHAGAHLVVHGRDPRRTGEVARQVNGVAVLADLGDPAGVAALVDRVSAAHGRIDILVACAGRGWSGPFVDMNEDQIGGLVAVDLLAPMLLARRLLPDMIARGTGHLGIVTSVAGRTGVAGEAVYAAAKAGLDAFAESVRLEVAGTGIGVGVVVPAAVRTDFFARRGRPYARSFPRPVAADAVARAVVDLIERDRAESWVPRWVRVAPVVRAVAPVLYRRLSVRFGEPVRSDGARTDRTGA